jgi:hypothetical protein
MMRILIVMLIAMLLTGCNIAYKMLGGEENPRYGEDGRGVITL